MIIHKILNNNVVITLDDDKREQIVMGKGIAFKKRIGDWVPDESIDQVFYLANQETSLKFQELLGNIPLEMMKLSDDIIVYAKSTLKKSLNDTIYISLTDHLYTALERKKQGIAIKNLLLWDIKRFFPEEYEVGVNALKMVQKRVGMARSGNSAFLRRGNWSSVWSHLWLHGRLSPPDRWLCPAVCRAAGAHSLRCRPDRKKERPLGQAMPRPKGNTGSCLIISDS